MDPNGSGKSNFLDALRLTAASLRGSLDHALRERSGLAEVRRKSYGHPNHFGIRLDFRLEGAPGFFAFEVAARAAGAYEIRHEACQWGGDISPAKIRELQTADPGDLLDREGSNLASVLEQLGRTSPVIKARIEEYLARVVPGIEGMNPRHVGHMETIEFRQQSSPRCSSSLSDELRG